MKKELAVLISFCLLLVIALPLHAAINTLSPAGKLFIKDAASAGMMEVQLGQLARDKGNAQEVKDFADRMVVDHTRWNDELKEIAAQRNLKLPAQIGRKHRLILAKLSKLSGDKFDREYLQAMVKNHDRDIAQFRKAVKKVKDHELNAWAASTLPAIEQHLQLAKEATQKLGKR